MIKSAKFITSATSVSQWESQMREKGFADLAKVAFVGRSNVGKSSLINKLVNQKNLAITSSTPGRTRLINFFQVKLRLDGGEAKILPLAKGSTPEGGGVWCSDKDLFFIDLPGYGFAKASKSMQGGWGDNIQEFLLSGISLVFVLVDIRIEPTDLDMRMIAFLQAHSIPFKIVATKVDKLSRAELTRATQNFSRKTGITTGDIIPTSAKSGGNNTDLYTQISGVVH